MKSKTKPAAVTNLWETLIANRSLHAFLAANKNLPEEYQLRLYNDADELSVFNPMYSYHQLMRLATNEGVTSSVQKLLLKKNTHELRHYLARNKGSTEETLRALCELQDVDLRQDLEDNPNTPPDVKETLQEWDRLVEKAQSRDLSAADALSLLDKGLRFVHWHLARNKHLPEEALLHIARIEDITILSTFVDNEGMTETVAAAVYERLAAELKSNVSDPNQQQLVYVLGELAEKEVVSPEVQVKMVQFGKHVCGGLLNNPKLCPEAVDAMMKLPFKAELKKLMARKKPEGKGSEDEEASAYRDVRTTKDPAKLLAFAKHPDRFIRVAVARNEHTPAEAYLLLARDKIKAVLQAVAEHAKI
jgi:hypothetical protein